MITAIRPAPTNITFKTALRLVSFRSVGSKRLGRARSVQFISYVITFDILFFN